jgi:hypothetical protein
VTARAWLVARKARTLVEAHAALVAVRPIPEADSSVWVNYYLRSAAIYAEVAELDPGHHGHAMYWADREKAKADLLIGQAETSNGSRCDRRTRRPKRGDATTAGLAVMPASLTEAHQALSRMRPSTVAQRAAWLDFHRCAAVVFTDVAEVDRLHHHEALFYAGLARRHAARVSGQTEDGAESESTSDSTHHIGMEKS